MEVLLNMPDVTALTDEQLEQALRPHFPITRPTNLAANTALFDNLPPGARELAEQLEKKKPRFL